MPNGRKPLCDMTGVDEDVKDLVRDLNKHHVTNGVTNGVNGDAEVKTEDQNVPEGLVGFANGAEGKTVWGIGKLNHVLIRSKDANGRDFELNCFICVSIGNQRVHFYKLLSTYLLNLQTIQTNQ